MAVTLAECLLLAVTRAARVEVSSALVAAGEVRMACSTSALLMAKPVTTRCQLNHTVLVANDSNFYTIASRTPFATYHVLWYRLPGFHHFSKVEVLLPEIMNIPTAWMDHRALDKLYLWQKQHVDARDIGELLELAVEKYDVNVKREGKWLPESFLRAATTRVKAHVKSFPDSAEQWRDIGFSV
ncbi:hypothetical protein C8J57DRAFT_1439140 [Mycena rebaudengoi]|nr:hypothetical protein C8J57DRAFT_1439140 [Mycena rebaudengoi]